MDGLDRELSSFMSFVVVCALVSFARSVMIAYRALAVGTALIQPNFLWAILSVRTVRNLIIILVSSVMSHAGLVYDDAFLMAAGAFVLLLTGVDVALAICKNRVFDAWQAGQTHH